MGTTAKPTGRDDSLCTLQLLMFALISLLMSSPVMADDSITPVTTNIPVMPTTRNLDHNESLLSLALHDMQQGQLELALQQIELLLHNQPDFHLAQLIHGDLLLAHAQALDTLGNTGKSSAQLEDLRAEARARLDSLLQPPPDGTVPEQVLQLASNIPHVIIVDTQESRLYVYANQLGSLHYIADYYVTIGKKGSGKSKEGDERTPLGVYFITQHLQNKTLEHTYGSQAFPLSFPNDWDKRQGLRGHGIWLHGTFSGTYNRPPHASDGCVVMTNTDLNSLVGYIILNITPVVITDHIRWITPQQAEAKRMELLQHMTQWQQDWQSLDIDHYLMHYDHQFTDDRMDFTQWSANKRRIAPSKNWIKVTLTDVSLFEYPGQRDVYLADFKQDYRSNNVNNIMSKHQYWQQQGNQWKILAENTP